MTKVVPMKKKPKKRDERPLYPGGIDDLPFVESKGMSGRAFNKILAGAREALEVARGNPAVIRNIKVYPSCGCVFCDIELPVYRDDQGFYHDGPEDTRIACGAPEDIE
jgi:hypothetical protein